MKTVLVFGCILALAAATCAGIMKYKYIDNAMRVIVACVAIELVSEIALYITDRWGNYGLRAAITNIYSIIEACLIAIFFILSLKPHKHRRLVAISTLFWPLIGVLNMLFLQPIDELNSNFLLVQSFGVITMSLYFIYAMLKKDDVRRLFANPHFRIAILWLVIWSATLFFWATIKILYINHWEYTEALMHIHAMITVGIYIGIGATLFSYPKKPKFENV